MTGPRPEIDVVGRGDVAGVGRVAAAANEGNASFAPRAIGSDTGVALPDGTRCIADWARSGEPPETAIGPDGTRWMALVARTGDSAGEGAAPGTFRHSPWEG
jgi:hypothetical protein